MRFLGSQNALKYVYPAGGPQNTPPNVLATLRKPTCKGEKRKEKMDRKKREEGDRRRGGNVKRKKGEEGPE